MEPTTTYDNINVSEEYKIPIVKRIFDIVFASSVLAFASPVLILIIIAIKATSKGPVFYKSKRVGSNYKIFDFYKFRSMEVGADSKLQAMSHLNQYSKQQSVAEKDENIFLYQCEDCIERNTACSNVLFLDDKTICEKLYLQNKKLKSDSTFVKISNDPRVTKIGKFLRNSSLDELPQLINVVKGDMSIVGNRPLPLYEAEKLTTDQYTRRFIAPSGITGLWQVTKRGKKEMSAEERVLLDVFYARKYSLKRDIYILLRTIPALFQKDDV